MALGAKARNLNPVTDAELKKAIAALVSPALCPVCRGPLNEEVEGRPPWRKCCVKIGVEESEDSSGEKITAHVFIFCKGFDGRTVDEARAAASRYQEIR